MDYNTNEWKQIPYELVPYISVEPQKAKYLSYSTAESFYKLDISEMDKAIAESGQFIYESLKNHHYSGTFDTLNYSFEYAIFDDYGTFGITFAKAINSEVEEVVNERYNRESGRYNEREISKKKDITDSKSVGYSRGSTAATGLDETTGYRETRGTRHIEENTRNTKEVKYSLSNKELDNSSFNFGSEEKRYEDLNSKKQKDYIEIETNRLIRNMDVDQITYQEIDDIISEPDNIELSGSTKENKPSLIFSKIINNKYELVEFVSDKHMTLEVKTIYNLGKIKEAEFPLVAQRPNGNTINEAHASSYANNISQSNNNVKSDTLSNNSNMQDNIKYSLSGKEFKPTKYDLENYTYLDYNTNEWKQIPYELVPYISVEPQKAKYLSYSTAESFYKLDFDTMDSAIAIGSGYAAKAQNDGFTSFSFYYKNYQFFADILDTEQNTFGITRVRTIKEISEEVIDETNINTNRRNIMATSKNEQRVWNWNNKSPRYRGASIENAELLERKQRQSRINENRQINEKGIRNKRRELGNSSFFVESKKMTFIILYLFIFN